MNVFAACIRSVFGVATPQKGLVICRVPFLNGARPVHGRTRVQGGQSTFLGTKVLLDGMQNTFSGYFAHLLFPWQYVHVLQPEVQAEVLIQPIQVRAAH